MRTVALTLLAIVALSPPLLAQDTDQGQQSENSTQLWADFILSFPRSEKLYLEYDIEAARQVSGGDPWRYLYGTGLVEFYPNRLIDLTGELVTGYTRQSQAEDSFELTARLGLRLHLISRVVDSHLVDRLRRERIASKRTSFATLLRVEGRHFNYTGDRDSSSDVRLRARLEFQYALNRPSLTEDGVWYLKTDGEYFLPLTDDSAAERFATKFRLRAGLGYRMSYRWRFEGLLMRDDARDTLEDEFSVDSYIVNLLVKRFF